MLEEQWFYWSLKLAISLSAASYSFVKVFFKMLNTYSFLPVVFFIFTA